MPEGCHACGQEADHPGGWARCPRKVATATAATAPSATPAPNGAAPKPPRPPPQDGETTLVLAHWIFAGTGLSAGEQWLAASLEPAPGTEGEPTT